MNEESIKTARDAYGASISLWFKHVNTPGGHPGVSGPSGGSDAPRPWSELESTIETTIDTLKVVLQSLKKA